jgi:hypothetical protein
MEKRIGTNSFSIEVVKFTNFSYYVKPNKVATGSNFVEKELSFSLINSSLESVDM